MCPLILSPVSDHFVDVNKMVQIGQDDSMT